MEELLSLKWNNHRSTFLHILTILRDKGDIGWQGEGSNLNFPGHLNFSPTDSSSQNAPGVDTNIQLRIDEEILQHYRSGAFPEDDPNFHKSENKQCLVCGHKFRWRWMLVRHMKIHTGEKPYSCPFCPYAAAQKFSVTKHILNKHPDHATTNPEKYG